MAATSTAYETAISELAAADAARAKAVKKINDLKNVVYKDALAHLEEKKIDFNELMAYYKSNAAPVVFRVSYKHPHSEEMVTFERRQGALGRLPQEVKEQLKALGRDKLATGIVIRPAGEKVLESIYKN